MKLVNYLALLFLQMICKQLQIDIILQLLTED